MRKLWLVVKHDYFKNVRQKGFLIALFSLPLFIGLSVGLGYFMQSQNESSDSIGYIDYSGVLETPLSLMSVSDRERVDIIQYSNIDEAEEMIKNDSLQAYFVIPRDYPQDKNIELYYYDEPGENAGRDFYDFLQLNLMSDYPLEIQKRVTIGTNSIVRTPDGRREFADNNPSVNIFLPLIIGLGFVLLLLISSGYLMSGFMDEKSNRTIELIFTSLSPTQLIGSKLVTMVAIGLTMLITWIAVGIIAFILGANFLDLPWMKEISINWRDIFTILAVALPSYMFAAALMLGISLLLGNNQEAESVGPLFFMVAFIPLYFIAPITRELNGPIAVALSILPISSILTVGLRSIFIQIPLWQLIMSVVLQLLLVLGAVWLAISTFRSGMLRTGSRIRWNELFPGGKKRVSKER
ncbi:MAG: ABC transporter permease [Anaerolineaceae bacterium]|nr:ABC transporter permease [Anaerolineaceae bacterium]